MKSILVVPQTAHNAKLLLGYMLPLLNTYKISFLRSRFFGEHSDMGGSAEPFEVLAPDFLQKVYNRSESSLLLAARKNQQRMAHLLKSLNPDLVVLGCDGVGLGGWIASTARGIGIRTLVCQEGCRALYTWHIPIWLRFKQLGLAMVTAVLNPHLKKTEDYARADYVCTWGKYDFELAVKLRKRADGVYIVGNPKFTRTSEWITREAGQGFTALFLDMPAGAWPSWMCDREGAHKFRAGIAGYFKGKTGFQLQIKVHPLTPEWEREKIRALSCEGSTEVIESGLAEDYFSGADVCITYPSTAVYSALTCGIPLILLHPKFRAFKKLLWDPVERYGAGVKISDVNSLDACLMSVLKTDWLNDYRMLSRLAGIEVMGPLGERAPEKFADAVEQILGIGA